MALQKPSKYSTQEAKTDIWQGKVPPNALDAEKSVLGAIMLFGQAADTAMELLKPEMFYSSNNQKIFSACQALYAKHQQLDIVSVCHQLGQDLAEITPFEVTKLTNSVTDFVSVQNHCRIIIEKAMKRRQAEIGAELLTKSYDISEDPFDVSDHAESELSKLRLSNASQPFKHISGIAVETLMQIDEARAKNSEITGIPSGFSDLDKITLGWQSPDLIILAARPSVGKTAFALTCARNAAEYFITEKMGRSVGFFSLEMSNVQLNQRVLSSVSNIPLWNIKSGQLNDSDYDVLMNASEGISKLPIFVDDTGGLSVQEFTSKARTMKRKHNVGIIFVDYLQLMKNKEKGNREQEISSISQTLKNTAKELEIPVIALSQMNREFAKTATREPNSSDLRESGAIEQDADLIMFLYNPNEAQLMENSGISGHIFAKIDKHRSGSAPERFISKFNKTCQQHLSFKLIDANYNLIGDKWSPVNTSSEQAPF